MTTCTRRTSNVSYTPLQYRPSAPPQKHHTRHHRPRGAPQAVSVPAITEARQKKQPKKAATRSKKHLTTAPGWSSSPRGEWVAVPGQSAAPVIARIAKDKGDPLRRHRHDPLCLRGGKEDPPGHPRCGGSSGTSMPSSSYKTNSSTKSTRISPSPRPSNAPTRP